MTNTLHILRQRVERSYSRRGTLALALVGEPGIGKTHLSQQLLAEGSITHLQLHTRSFETGFAPLLKLPGIPLWVRQTLEHSLNGHSSESGVLATAVGALLSRAAPIVIWAEDFHESNEYAAHFWTALAQNLPRDKGVVLLVTSRTVLPEPYVELRVQPLDQSESRLLLQQHTQEPLPEAALDWLQARCSGNPLFLLEFFRHLSRNGALYQSSGHWYWREPATSTLPIGVEALIADHLCRLQTVPETNQEVPHLLGLWALWNTALPSEPLDVSDTAALCGLSRATVEELEGQARRAGLLAQQGFAHPLLREVALKELPYRQRRNLARQCIAFLSTEPERAVHFLPWAELSEQQTASLLERALTAAQARGAQQSCADYLNQLADIVPLQDRASAALNAAQALEPFQFERALTRATQARQLDPLNFGALSLCARLLSKSGRGQEAERLLKDAPESMLHRPEFWACWLQVRVNASDFTGALELWESHQARLENISEVPPLVAMAQLRTGQAASAEASIRRALSEQPPPAERTALLQALGRIQIAQADPQMFVTLGEAIEISAQAGLTSFQASLLLERARVLSWALQVPAATADAREAVRLAEGQDDPRLLARTQGELASCLMIQGEFEAAQELLLHSHDLLGCEQASAYTILTQLYLCNLSLEWGRPQDRVLAIRHARQALRLTTDLQDQTLRAWVMSISAWAEGAYGDLNRAACQIEEGEAYIRATGQQATVPFYLFAAGFVLERRGETQAAIQKFEAACDLGRRMKMPAYAERFGLEADRLQADQHCAERRLAFFRQHGFASFVYRTLNYFPALSSDAVAVSPEDPAHSPPEVGAPVSETLCLEVLGQIRMTCGGKALPERSLKGQRLLVQLLEGRLAGRLGLTQDELLETLYPDDDPQRSAVRLRQQVRRVRAAYGASSILRTEQGYALGPIASDAEAFLQTRETALWRGAYLADLPEFLSSARDVLTYGLRLAAYAAEPQQAREAARLGQILLEMDPFDWAALSLTLRCLRESGEVLTLLSVYGQIRQRCALLGEPLPDTWQGFLATQEMSAR